MSYQVISAYIIGNNITVYDSHGIKSYIAGHICMTVLQKAGYITHNNLAGRYNCNTMLLISLRNTRTKI